MDNQIKCPKCGEEIAISEALTHQIQDEILSTVQAQHKKELQEAKKAAEKSLEESKHQLELQIAKKFQEQFEIQLKIAKEEAQENKARNKQLTDELSDLMKQMRQMKTEQEELKLNMEKQLAQEEEKIRADAQRKAEDEQRLKILEKDKQLQDAIKANEELRRKLQQGSQQTQGEVLELELEENLRKEFPNDKVSPVGKGIRGADVVQEVWDRNGNLCGKILWELKNTKSWDKDWIPKLKANQRELHADMAIIVSEILPQGVHISGYREGVWITERNFALCIASVLRANVIQAHFIRQSVKGKNEKMEILYGYLSGTEFKHRVEAIIEAFTNMQDEIEKEKRYFMNKWSRDEKNIRMVIDNTFGMHGDLKAIVGGALPQIKGLEESDVEVVPDGVVN